MKLRRGGGTPALGAPGMRSRRRGRSEERVPAGRQRWGARLEASPPWEHPGSTQRAPSEHPRRARGAADIFRALPAAALGGWGVCSGLEGGIRALPTQRPQPGSAAFTSAAHTDAPGWRGASTAWVRMPGASWRGVGMGQGVLLLGRGAGSFHSWRSAASHPLLGWGQKGRDNSRQKQVAWTWGRGKRYQGSSPSPQTASRCSLSERFCLLSGRFCIFLPFKNNFLECELRTKGCGGLVPGRLPAIALRVAVCSCR